MKIGILSLQGDFLEHEHALQRLDVDVVQVRLPHDLDELAGLIIPGGESTTFAKLAVRFDLIAPLRAFANSGIAMWGTCAGLIFLAKDVGRDQITLRLMDLTVKRNAFGRQIDSFTTGLMITGIEGDLFPGVFIRAPIIERLGSEVRILSTLEDGRIVAARQNNLLVTSFHPELTDDLRVHQYFLRMCEAVVTTHL